MDAEPPQPLPFLDYTPESLKTATDRLIAKSSKVWDQVAVIPPPGATFANAVLPLIHEENERLAEFRILHFLSGASTSKEVREASKEASIRLSQDNVQRLTRQDVYHVVAAVAEKQQQQQQQQGQVEGGVSQDESLSPESQLYLSKLVREFVANGLGLTDANDRARLKDVNLRLVEVLKEYIANLNADTTGIWLSSEELDGVASSVIERLKQDGENGKYWVSFKTPNRVAIMSRARSAAVRRKYYTAWDNRMSDVSGPLLNEMLQLRRQSARLLGYDNYAEFRDDDRMLSAHDALCFLESVTEPLINAGRKEIEQLVELKKAELNELPEKFRDESSTGAIFRWDFSYYRRIAKEQSSKIDSDRLSEYFSFQLVLPKLFQIFSLLFGLRFEILSTDSEKVIPKWHKDVIVSAVWDDEEEGGGFIGYLYIDPHPREGKYGHVGQFGLQPVSLAFIQSHQRCRLRKWSAN